jgi:hypothetical protein
MRPLDCLRREDEGAPAVERAPLSIAPDARKTAADAGGGQAVDGTFWHEACISSRFDPNEAE